MLVFGKTFYYNVDLKKNHQKTNYVQLESRQSNILVSAFSVVDVHVMRENSILDGAIRLIFLLNGI